MSNFNLNEFKKNLEAFREVLKPIKNKKTEAEQNLIKNARDISLFLQRLNSFPQNIIDFSPEIENGFLEINNKLVNLHTKFEEAERSEYSIEVISYINSELQQIVKHFIAIPNFPKPDTEKIAKATAEQFLSKFNEKTDELERKIQPAKEQLDLINNSQNDLETEVKNFINAKQIEVSEMVNDIKESLVSVEEIESTVKGISSVIGDTAKAEGYLKHSAETEKISNNWLSAALWLLFINIITTAVFVFCMKEFDLLDYLKKLPITTALTGLSVYAFRVSSRFRAESNYSKYKALDLLTIKQFVEDINDSEIILGDFAKRVFAEYRSPITNWRLKRKDMNHISNSK